MRRVVLITFDYSLSDLDVWLSLTRFPWWFAFVLCSFCFCSWNFIAKLFVVERKLLDLMYTSSPNASRSSIFIFSIGYWFFCLFAARWIPQSQSPNVSCSDHDLCMWCAAKGNSTCWGAVSSLHWHCDGLSRCQNIWNIFSVFNKKYASSETAAKVKSVRYLQLATCKHQ